MKILITGYKGFIGQNMVKALEHEHDLVLYEYGNPIPDFKGLDWVVHLGAITDTTERDVEKIMKYNFDFSCVLLVTCQAHNVNLQYASSASVYGLTDNFSEDAPCSPQNPYAWSKYLFDRNVQSLKLDNIIVQGFRYFNVYGSHEEHKGDQASPFSKFEKQAREEGVIRIFQNSHQYWRDFVHVDKVVEIHKKFLSVKKSGIWNVGTGTIKSFQQVAEEIAKKYNAKIEYFPMPSNLKNQYQNYTCADLTKIRKEIDI